MNHLISFSTRAPDPGECAESPARARHAFTRADCPLAHEETSARGEPQVKIKHILYYYIMCLNSWWSACHEKKSQKSCASPLRKPPL